MPGVYISDLEQGGAGSNAGLQKFDVIYKYNENKINSANDLIEAIRIGGDENVLITFRGSEIISSQVGKGSLSIGIESYPPNDFVIPGVSSAFERANQGDLSSRYLDESEVLAGIIATTAPSVDGHQVTRTIDIVSAEHVFATSSFLDQIAAVMNTPNYATGLAGTAHPTLQKAFRKHRQACMLELKREAHSLGANAIIGVSISFGDVTSANRSYFLFAITGTAVVIQKTTNQPHDTKPIDMSA